MPNYQNLGQRELRIKARLAQPEADRIAAGLPVRHYQAKCDMRGCKHEVTSPSIHDLSVMTHGWYIGISEFDPNCCPNHEPGLDNVSE